MPDTQHISSYLRFARSLAHDIALPILSEGYALLFQQIRQNAALARKVRDDGIDALLSGESDETEFLRKSNKELATEAERKAEAAMRAAVNTELPDHAIVGEELGVSPGNDCRWVFDPVDGTSAMLKTLLHEAFDIPLLAPAPGFGTTIGFAEGECAVLGLVMELQPMDGKLTTGSTWLGAKCEPPVCDDVLLSLPALPPLAESTLACTVPEVMFHDEKSWGGYQALADAVKHCLHEQNCIGFMRLLEGGAHIAYEADLAYHDVLALVPILEGAGFTVTSGSGARLSFAEENISHEYSILAAQAPLHAQALTLIQTGVTPDRNRFRKPSHAKGYTQKFVNPS